MYDINLCWPVSCGALQLVQEFKVLLLLGRRLVFPEKTTAAVITDVATDSVQDRKWPAEEFALLN